jgi:trk system potassium uptake protein TrkH
VLKSEELKWYLGIIFIAILIIFFNTYNIYNSFNETLRHSSFQVASIITTTGYSSFNFNNWPGLSKTILIILMFIGACAGSTGGGMKISRIVIYFKIAIREIRQSIFPRQIRPITFEKKPIDELTRNGVTSYLTAYIFLFIIATLVISIEGKDLVTNFTAVAATINNIGPGLEIVGPMGNFSSFSNLSKITFSIVMLAGRLELFPILILFSPKLWIKK